MLNAWVNSHYVACNSLRKQSMFELIKPRIDGANGVSAGTRIPTWMNIFKTMDRRAPRFLACQREHLAAVV